MTVKLTPKAKSRKPIKMRIVACADVTNLKRYSKRNHHVVSISYTGSPDSEDVAKLITNFHYAPEKREAVLKKYEDLAQQKMVR